MPSPCMVPIAIFPVEWQTTWKPPENHSHLSTDVILPAGIIGFSLISPLLFHVPTKYPSFWTSGPGLGASIFFSSARTARTDARKQAANAAIRMGFMVSSFKKSGGILCPDRDVRKLRESAKSFVGALTFGAAIRLKLV